MPSKFRYLFTIVSLAHVVLMVIPIGVKTVIELNIVKPAPIQIRLISHEEDTQNFKFVETSHDGTTEEVDTKLLSDVTQKVEEQTVSTKTRSSNSGGKTLQDSKRSQNNSSKKTPNFSDLGILPGEAGKIPSKSTSEAASGGDGLNLGTDVESLPVFMEDVAESDRTSLSTIQYDYASFYKRINGQVYNSWVPQIQQLNPDSFARKSFQTLIILKINSNGEIMGIKLEKSSGEEILDSIAQQAFAKVRVFSNPPKELFNGKSYLYLTWLVELRND